MTLQIRQVVLWNKSGDVRAVDFRVGELNIVTGRSKTGKSSLLHIVDYCLASSGYSVPAGVIREAVSWYGLVLHANGNNVLVARPAPGANRATTTQMHFSVLGGGLALPNLPDLIPNADIPGARRYLSELAGILANEHVPKSGTRLPLTATIRHSLYFCMQEQGEISSSEILFHNQAGEFIPQAIRDVFPYFLGVADADQIAKRDRLRRLLRERTVLRSRLDD